jgi:tetratricopeptide (TPR) repeat protein
MERYDEALADHTRATELDPSYALAIARRGQTYRLMERYDEALADLNHAIELNPSDAEFIAQRGATYRLMGRLLPGVEDADEGVIDGADVKAPPGVSRGGALVVWVSSLSVRCRCGYSSRSSLTAVRAAASSTMALFAANVATSDCSARLLTARG